MTEKNKLAEVGRAKSTKVKLFFYTTLCLYGLGLALIMRFFNPDGEQDIWFYFGCVIGSIFVFIAFYYYHENFISPALQEIKSGKLTEITSIQFRLFAWLLPALAIQLFVVVGFSLTVQKAPFADSLYTHPYLYGLHYKKLEGMIKPEIDRAALMFSSENIKLDKAQTAQTAEYLRNIFGEYVKECPPFVSGTTNDDSEKAANIQLENSKLIQSIISCIYKIPFFIALTFGFLGTLMYSLNDMRHRYFISDLYPKTYIGYLIRFLFTPALCMVIAYFFMNDWITNLAPALFFMVGFFPQMALRFLEEKARQALSLKKKEKKEIPLELLQGMTDYFVYRFKELGTGDAQNLAYADLNYMRKNWSNDRLLCDFIAQALLLIHFSEDFSNLQSHGIRN